MKSISILFLTLSTVLTIGQNGNTYVIPQYKKVVECNYSSSQEHCSFSDFVWHGDTLINNDIYTKVTYNQELFAMVREDTIADSLFVINLDGDLFKSPIIRDQSVGDTITFYSWHYQLFWNWGNWTNTYSKEKINKIEQVTINGRTRNKYYFTYITDNGGPSEAYLTFIEGVGITSFMYLSGTASVECFFENNQLGIDNYNGDPAEKPCGSFGIYVGTKNPLIDQLTLFPNPTTGIIQYYSEVETQVRVCSITGELLITRNLGEKGLLSLTNYPSGIYFLEFSSANHSVVKRVVKL